MSDIPVVICRNQSDLLKFFHRGNRKFVDQLCKTLKNGVDEDLVKVAVCDITYDGVTKFRINIHKRDFKDALSRLLKIYEKEQLFEKCIIVKETLDKINNK